MVTVFDNFGETSKFDDVLKSEVGASMKKMYWYFIP